MNFVKASLLLLTCGVFSNSTVALAASRIPNSSFQDWSGEVLETRLPDGSWLTEYTASTAGAVEGAMLALSFVPRFECVPLISLRLPDAIDGADGEPLLEFSVDGTAKTFSGHIDDDGDFLLYALQADTDELMKLRQEIDLSSKVRVRLLPVESGNESSTDNDAVAGSVDETQNAQDDSDSLEFSLLGSQRSALAVEERCKTHESVVYEPDKDVVQSE